MPAGEVVPVQGAELLLQTEDAECQVGGGHDQEADAVSGEEQAQALRQTFLVWNPFFSPPQRTYSTMKIFRSW